jgi:hypothetical protein
MRADAEAATPPDLGGDGAYLVLTYARVATYTPLGEHVKDVCCPEIAAITGCLVDACDLAKALTPEVRVVRVAPPVAAFHFDACGTVMVLPIGPDNLGAVLQWDDDWPLQYDATHYHYANAPWQPVSVDGRDVDDGSTGDSGGDNDDDALCDALVRWAHAEVLDEQQVVALPVMGKEDGSRTFRFARTISDLPKELSDRLWTTRGRARATGTDPDGGAVRVSVRWDLRSGQCSVCVALGGESESAG